MPRKFRPRAFLLAAWGINVCINAFYIAPSAVFPQMIPGLGISNAAAGSLISFYLLAILLFQLPSGFIVDRADPRRIIAVASLAVLGLSVLMTLLPRYDALLLLRTLAGIPVAFIFAPAAFLVSRAFERTPGRAVGIFLSAPPAGVAVGNLFSPILAVTYGWPVVMCAFNLPLLVLVPAFVIAAKGMPERRHEPFSLRDFLAAFRNRELWKVGLVFAASYASYIFYSSWATTYMNRTGIASPVLVGVLAAMIPAAGILSRPAGGFLAEGRFGRDKRVVPAIAFGLLFASSVAIPFLGAAGIPLLVACGFLAQFPFSVYYLFSTQILPLKFQGTAYAFNNTVSILGGAVSPAFAGYLVDVTGSFVAAFIMIAASALVGLGLLFAIRER
ncbi:MAG: MFS transporter [Methanobacteriota archaeon]|nr:MAG: MFS transporter [Euryarchaeota archaeon]